jgi:taurine dioxygenase
MPPVVATYRLPGYEAIEELTNTATDTRTGEKTLLYRGGSWHTDHSNLACPPKATTLYAIDLPPSGGGNTDFINMMMAYEALDPATRETLRGRRAFQAYISRRAPRKLLARTDAEKQGSDGVWQPMVRRHPETGRAALYLNPMRCDAVEEMEQAEGDVLLDALYAHADQTQFQYSHGWSAGDMLIWDNRSCLHQATPVRRADHGRLEPSTPKRCGKNSHTIRSSLPAANKRRDTALADRRYSAPKRQAPPGQDRVDLRRAAGELW